MLSFWSGGGGVDAPDMLTVPQAASLCGYGASALYEELLEEFQAEEQNSGMEWGSMPL